MNKHAAQSIVYHLTASSLRKLAKRTATWATMPGIPVNLTDAEKAKVAREMNMLAERLEGKFPEENPVEPDPA